MSNKKPDLTPPVKKSCFRASLEARAMAREVPFKGDPEDALKLFDLRTRLLSLVRAVAPSLPLDYLARWNLGTLDGSYGKPIWRWDNLGNLTDQQLAQILYQAHRASTPQR